MMRSLIAMLVFATSCFVVAGHAKKSFAPVEARIPFPPSAFVGSDGLNHLAYEMHITNFYDDTGPLRPMSLKVFADDATSPLLTMYEERLSQVIRPASSNQATLPIPPGRRAVIFIWVTLPIGAAIPHTLRHHIDFINDKRDTMVLDGADVRVSDEPPMTIGPPLRGGRWLAHEGPGAAQSHHWGSLVAVNGRLTIPQRYAFDFVGLDSTGHAIRPEVKNIQESAHADWIGYGTDVLAVADGVVRSARDDTEEHRPLEPQPEPASLTTDVLFGNYVVLEIAPGTFASYAHLRRGSLRVKPGEWVRRGQALAQLGQSGNSAAPHLHFQLSNAATFEGSEGVPFLFNDFGFLGPESEAQLFGKGEPWKPAAIEHRRGQMPLNDVVVQFPSQ